MSNAIFVLGLIYFGAHLFTAVFEKTKVPDVLLLILIGLIAGPMLGLVLPSDFGIAGGVMTTIALIVILFESGTNLELDSMRKALVPTLVLSLATAIVTLLLFAFGAKAVLGLSTPLALCLGAILAGTSSAVVIPLVVSLKIREPGATILILESAITDVLCIVLTLGFANAALKGESSALELILGIIASLGISSLVGLIGGGIWIMVLTKLRDFPNTMFTTIAFIFLLYGVNEFLGFSGAITALTFGVALANYRRLGLMKFTEWAGMVSARVVDISDFEKGLYRELVFIFKTFFFIYLGLSIPFEEPLLLILATALAVILYVVRLFLVRYLAPAQTNARDAALMTILVPKGLAAAVLAGLPEQMGVPDGEKIKSLAYMTVLITILMTALLIPALAGTRFGGWVERLASRRGQGEAEPAEKEGELPPSEERAEERNVEQDSEPVAQENKEPEQEWRPDV